MLASLAEAAHFPPCAARSAATVTTTQQALGSGSHGAKDVKIQTRHFRAPQGYVEALLAQST